MDFSDVNGQFRLEEKLLKEKLDSIGIEHQRIGSIIEERTKLDKEAIGKLFLGAETKNSTFALEHGFVEAIQDANIPAGATVVPLVFQR